MKTTAKKVDGGYLLNGAKIFITNGGEAQIVTVLAYTDKDKGNRGISMLILEKGDAGFTVGKHEHKMGMHGSDTRELVFEDVFVPADRLLGPEGGGFRTLMTTFNYTRPAVGGQALGIAQGALEAAINYTTQREQFNKKITAFQGVTFQLADMATQVQAARLLVYNAAYRASAHLSYSQESAMAKLFASETAMRVTTQAVQLFGGYGYTREFPVERMMRDAKITEIYEGTSEVQRVVIGAALTR
jgi:alkylation response protein AidB-like acyl-CoA dehydrogenase